MAEPSTSPSYAKLYDDVTITRHENEDASKWGVDEVSAWLQNIGLGEHGKNFKKHKLTGVQLKSLTEAHLTELGVTLIGDRLTLLAEMSKIPFLTSTVLWEDDEVHSFAGPVDYCCKIHVKQCVRKLTCQRPLFWDHYTLTSSALVVTQRERGVLADAACCGRAVKVNTRHIDLENITGITTNTASKDSQACDFGVADTITIELDKMKMLRQVHPLVVAKGESAHVVAKIMNQVQKNRGGAGAIKAPQRPATMAR